MTESEGFSPERSEAIRDELVRVAGSADSRTWASRGAAVALVLAGVVAGGGAVAATAQVWRPTPSTPAAVPVIEPTANPGVPAPEGHLPGQPIISLVGVPETFEVAGEERIIQLDPPVGATHLRVSVTCTTVGRTGWGFDPGGNNNSSECGPADLAPGSRSGTGWMDHELGGQEFYYVQPDPEVAVIVTLQYLNVVETAWGVNANGETYGVTKPGIGDPDLVAAQGVDAAGQPVIGYIRYDTQDEMWPGQPLPSTPEEAIELQEQREELYPNGWDLPLYAEDGVTQVGTFHVG